MIVKDIPIKNIEKAENIRQIVKDENISALMQTIKDNGLLQPIGVKETRKNYIIIWGNRRLEACTKLGWKAIPAVIFSEKDESMSEEQFFVINAIENLQQKPNTLFELGRICKILRKTMSAGEIAVRLSIPKSRVDNALVEISRIPVKWQKKIRLMNDGSQKKGDIPMITAAKVSRLRGLTDKDKNTLFKHISKNEEGGANVDMIGSLMKSGKKFNDAVKVTNKYRSVDFKIFVDIKKFDEAVHENGDSNVDFVINTINERYPNLAFKNIRER